MKKKPKKRLFPVTEGETVATILKRMEEEGYEPVRKMQTPVFREVIGPDGEKNYEPVKSEIVFEGRLKQ